MPIDQVLANWATVVAPITILLGALVAIRAIRANRRVSRQETAFKYLQRQDSGEFVPVIMGARDVWLLRESQTMAQGKARYEALSYQEKVQIFRVFNFYEELSAFYGLGLLDKQVASEMLAPTVMLYWEEAFWLVDDIRGGYKGMFSCWEKLYNELREAGVAHQSPPDTYHGTPPPADR
jgi:hypothetical protein